MSGTAAWLPAAGVIALLIVSYWLRFWFHREVIYRPTGHFRPPPLTTDPSTTERIANLASADRRSPHA